MALNEAQRRAARRPGQPPARVIAFDAMWSHAGARRKGKRREVWVWTAVVEEGDGGRWVDLAVRLLVYSIV